MVAAVVGQYDTVAGTRACIEVEGAEIDPGGTTHLLIDAIFGGDALMPDGIVGIVDAAFDSLVTDVDRIASCLRDRWLPGDTTHLTPFASDFSLAGCSCPEGVLVVEIRTAMEGESHRVALAPKVGTANLMIA